MSDRDLVSKGAVKKVLEELIWPCADDTRKRDFELSDLDAAIDSLPAEGRSREEIEKLIRCLRHVHEELTIYAAEVDAELGLYKRKGWTKHAIGLMDTRQHEFNRITDFLDILDGVSDLLTEPEKEASREEGRRTGDKGGGKDLLARIST